MSYHRAEDCKLSPTSVGEDKMRAWLDAKKAEEKAERELATAKEWRRERETEFAKWMLPVDAKLDEKYLAWCGDDLLQVELTGVGPVVSIRRMASYGPKAAKP